MKTEREGFQRSAAGLSLQAVVIVGVVDELLDGKIEVQSGLVSLLGLWR